jgi:hypothetical protein
MYRKYDEIFENMILIQPYLVGLKSALGVSRRDFAFLLLTLFRQIQYPQGWSMLTISTTQK